MQKGFQHLYNNGGKKRLLLKDLARPMSKDNAAILTAAASEEGTVAQAACFGVMGVSLTQLFEAGPGIPAVSSERLNSCPLRSQSTLAAAQTATGHAE
ncbi:hypothetical protein ROHU_013107 [Labeo rohita]|uniref:Uncharacterized protein n=1 Tax=Labeo rohita TaxID=84645 RepID=A0A498L6T5_LABRO|nr:hypothetical protein ROHU_013107 [Labeo rohita]